MSGTHAATRRGGEQDGVGESRLRADARRNLDRILVAAREVFREQGIDAPLDEIARRAGVGIATLYRRFPDRQSLARAVALDVWRRSAQEAQRALAEEPTAFQALARYLHRALDLGIGAVMPLVVGQAILDDEARAARDTSADWTQRLVAAAQAEGTLRADLAYGDMGLLLVRLNRPLAAPFPRALDQAIAHRQLDILLAGLRAGAAQATPLPGPALTLDDLQAIAAESSKGERSS
ncbi:MAG TPA: helix-turn-helix domain-containing protein [Ktedonobacterales bacterium]